MDFILVAHPTETVERWVDSKCRLSHPKYIQLMCGPLAGYTSSVGVLTKDDVWVNAHPGDKIVYHGNMNFSVEKGKSDEEV